MLRALIAIVVFASAGLVFILARQNQELARQVSRTNTRVLLPYEGLLLPTISAATLDGDTVIVGEKPDGGRQILLVFTTTCPECRVSIPAFKSIVDSLQPEVSTGRVQVLGISLDSLRPTTNYRDKYSLPYRVALFGGKHPVIYRTRAVPLTLVLDSIGQVTYSRFGSVTNATVIDSIVHAARGKAVSAVREIPTRN